MYAGTVSWFGEARSEMGPWLFYRWLMLCSTVCWACLEGVKGAFATIIGVCPRTSRQLASYSVAVMQSVICNRIAARRKYTMCCRGLISWGCKRLTQAHRRSLPGSSTNLAWRWETRGPDCWFIGVFGGHGAISDSR
ncbi:hypothetical protein EJ04DRAFT_228236 [Polyplosphaeria fusca]|uniref:Uncharacterized protein n=1 Tax=Polyplosphaeria fusca TaxID=682080 RepID=A0A9P4V326_9PLEO|nr:hypothetical protein EJ04DRAFT_228236 [Polyplosphaeria fusca]